jgi:hypothetical protein
LDQLVRLVLEIREVVAIGMKIGVAGEHPVGAYDLSEASERRLELLGIDAGRQYRHLCSPLVAFGKRSALSGARRDRAPWRNDP